jgi:hypothetical protein
MKINNLGTSAEIGAPGDDRDDNRKRHRWKPTDDHFNPGPKYWRCIKCGLQKVTEYEEKPTYHWHDGRTWRRFAPPCPPERVSKCAP